MMNKIFVVAGVSLTLMIAACTEPPPASEAGAILVQSTSEMTGAVVLARAEVVYSKAKQKQHSWTSTARLLASAREALASGNENDAMIAAQRALFTAEASLTQAESQANAWQARVPQ